jgi:hypothetical protein
MNVTVRIISSQFLFRFPGLLYFSRNLLPINNLRDFNYPQSRPPVTWDLPRICAPPMTIWAIAGR